MQLASEDQDLKDRTSVAFLGVKEQKVTKQDMHLTSPRSVSESFELAKSYTTGEIPIKIDQKCISCQVGHDTSLVLSLFKIACLNYTPSNVKYRLHSLTRTEMLSIRRMLWDRLHIAAKRAQVFKNETNLP